MLASVLPHAGDPTGSLWTWAFDPSIMIGIAAWVVGYAWVTGPLQKHRGWAPVSRGRKTAFYLGTLILFLALVSPLDHLGDEYLFGAHMLQHFLLLLVAPPLWLYGLPDGFIDQVITSPRARKFTRWMVHPVTTYFAYNVLVWGWHIPSLYQAALENENIHILEHLTFLFAGVLGWWPIFGKSDKAAPRAGYVAQMIYLFGLMFPMTMLAALITFAKQPFYPFYAQAPRLWGLSVLADQQIAGLIMWIPGNLILFGAFTNSFYQWFKAQEKQPLLPEKPVEDWENLPGEQPKIQAIALHSNHSQAHLKS